MSKNLLSRLAQALDEAEIPYMIVGGQAVLGYIRDWLRQFDETLGGEYVERFERLLGATE